MTEKLFDPARMPERDQEGMCWHPDLEQFLVNHEGKPCEDDDEGYIPERPVRSRENIMTDPARLKRACEAFSSSIQKDGHLIPFPFLAIAVESAIAAYNQPEAPTVDKWRKFEQILRDRAKRYDGFGAIAEVLAEVNRLEVDRRERPSGRLPVGAGSITPWQNLRETYLARIAQLEAMLGRIAKNGCLLRFDSDLKDAVTRDEILSLLNTKEQGP